MGLIRLPAVLLVPAALAVGVVVASGDEPAPAPAATVQEPVAVVRPADARGSTWYCAAGTATGQEDTYADQTVILTNVGDTDAAASLTVAAADPDGAPVDATGAARVVEVPARSRVPVVVADLIQAQWAAVTVEADTGEIAVAHLLSGRSGQALSPSATTPSSGATFAAGATAVGSREILALYNPFPDEAVVSVTFETEDGIRTPEALAARVIPPRAVVAIEVGDHVAVREEVATTVAVRTGQVVVERIQSSDEGLALDEGAARASAEWWFPSATVSSARPSSLVIHNPDPDTVAKVEVAAVLDDGAPAPEPFAVDVAPGRYSVLPLDQDGRIPDGSHVALHVTATGGHRVTAELVEGRLVVPPGEPGSEGSDSGDGDGSGEGGDTDDGSGDATEDDGGGEAAEGGPRSGLAVSSGSIVAAPRWVLPVGTLTSRSASISVVNPGSRSVRVRLEGIGAGRRGPTGSAGDEVEVAAGARLELDTTGGLDIHPGSFQVVADGPVVVAQRFELESGEVLSSLGIPSLRGLAPLP